MKLKAIILTLVLATIVIGCSNADDLGSKRERTLRNQTGDIVVGVAWPFGQRNDEFREGLELALNEINQNGVLGNRITLVQKDDESSVTQGLAIAQSFAENSSMLAVIGHQSSSVTVPVSKVYQNSGLLLLAPSSTAPKLTRRGNKNLFRLLPNDTQIGNKMAKYAHAQGYRKAAIFYENDEYGRGLSSAIESSAKSVGIQTIDRITDYNDLISLKRLVEKWRLLGCDAVFVAVDMPAGARIISDLRKAGLDVPLIGGDGLDSAEVVNVSGKAAEGLVVASVFNPNSSDRATNAFVQAYRSTYGQEPNMWAAQAYDALKLLAAALEEAKSRQPGDISAVLKQSKSWPGVSGSRLFDAQGDVRDMPIVLKRISHGSFEYVNEKELVQDGQKK